MWTIEGRKAFDSIKNDITRSPVLVSPDYAKDFMIFSFASEDTIAGVLLQKNIEGFEQPIAFMSKALQNSELKYTIMEKQAYALCLCQKLFLDYEKTSQHNLKYLIKQNYVFRVFKGFLVVKFGDKRECIHNPNKN